MSYRLRLHCLLIIGIAGFSVLIGVAYAVVVPYTTADALEEAIRGAHSPDEVRERIADYYSSTTLNRLILLVGPALATAIVAAISLWELRQGLRPATNGDARGAQHKTAERLP